MNLLILTTVVAMSSAAQLPARNYIPQDQSSDQFQGHQSSSTVGGAGGGTGNTRHQQDAERNSAILKQDQEISDTGNYHFGFETSNGIQAEEGGTADQAQGGFSYKGDDGHTYTITYTSGEGGFRPQGEHLPVAPPTPEAILLALQQNERDEAAGIYDDGQYHPDVHGGGQQKPGFAGSAATQAAFGSTGHQAGFSSGGGYKY